jgi:hypothetical protein
MSVTFQDIPDDIQQHICHHVKDDAPTLSSFGLCGSKHAIIELKNMDNLWQKFIQVAEKPKSYDKTSCKTIDNTIRKFISNSNEKQITLEKLDSSTRYFMHIRSEQLQLEHTTINRIRHLGDVVVTKPDNWNYTIALNNMSAIKYKPDKKKRSDVPRGVSSRTYYKIKYCDECDCQLNYHTAMYHHSGMGPLCEDCIEDDDYLCGLKWENF